MSNGEQNSGKQENTPSRAYKTDAGRRQFLRYAAVGAVGVGIASAVEIPVLSNIARSDSQSLSKANQQISQLQSQVQSDQSQISSLQSQVASQQSSGAGSAFVDFSINEQKELEAIVETIIPSDSNGPGAKEAGVIYFISNQISSDYGTNARMYMNSPFVRPGLSGSITVDDITYPAGTITVPWQAGMQYQYNLSLREFWRYGLEALQNYSNSVLGKNFEDLNSSDQVQILNDCYDNKPTDFNGILPKDFIQEVIFMTWAGFFMDPVYGGNLGMVGWKYTGFTGADMMDAFNEGRDPQKLMVASSPTRFAPHSLAQYQATLMTTSTSGSTGGT